MKKKREEWMRSYTRNNSTENTHNTKKLGIINV